MADPVLQTRVLTPITLHLDNCKQCSDDLETIRKLNLYNTQLCQLGQMFAEKVHLHKDLCMESVKFISALVKLETTQIPPELLKNLSLCPDCRQLLFEKWSWELESLRNRAGNQQYSKKHYSERDLLCFAVPYITKNREENGLVALHTRECPECFERMLNLHQTIFQIYSRPRSGTVTMLSIDSRPLDSTGVAAETGESPVRIEVTHKTANMKRQGLNLINIKPIIKPAIAAMLVIAFALYFTSPTVASVDVTEIYKQLAKAVNVHIKRFAPDKTEPVQEQWVSRSLKTAVYKTESELVVWDIAKNHRVTKNFKSGEIENTAIPQDSMEVIKRNLEGSLGLFPFEILSDLPKNSKWQEVSEPEHAASDTPNIKKYELTWTIKDDAGLVAFKKWRVFIDETTNLPQRVEWYSKTNPNEDYALTAYALVVYISQSEINTLTGSMAF
jgi:hypothetical protein